MQISERYTVDEVDNAKDIALETLKARMGAGVREHHYNGNGAFAELKNIHKGVRFSAALGRGDIATKEGFFKYTVEKVRQAMSDTEREENMAASKGAFSEAAKSKAAAANGRMLALLAFASALGVPDDKILEAAIQPGTQTYGRAI